MHLLLTKVIPEGAACNTMPFCYTDTRMRGPLELKVDSVMRNHLEKPSNSIIGCSLGVSSFLWNAWEKPLNRFPCSTVQTRKPLKLSIWQILSCQSVIRPWFSSSSTCDQPWAQVSHSTRGQTCVRSRETLLCTVRHQLSHNVVQFVNFYLFLLICHLWSNHDLAVTIHIWLTDFCQVMLLSKNARFCTAFDCIIEEVW